MGIDRDEVELLLRLDEVRGFGRDAKRYVWSRAFAEAPVAGFFDLHPMDSAERLWIDEVATYFELAGVLWRARLVGQEAVDLWVPAATYWHRLGAVLVEERRVGGGTALWEHFEALAQSQVPG